MAKHYAPSSARLGPARQTTNPALLPTPAAPQAGNNQNAQADSSPIAVAGGACVLREGTHASWHLPTVAYSIDQLTGASYARVGYKTTAAFNQVRLRLSSDFLCVDLGENLFIHEVCTGGDLVDPPATDDV